MPFVHLHVHSCYSFLDGASEPEALVQRAAELGMTALALTDHNSVAGSVKFVTACQQYSIQPILGSEITLDDGSHLILIAQDQRGYSNLNRLLSLAYEQGGRRTPALPWEMLGSFTDGLICLSGCRQGKVPTLIRSHRSDEAEAEARRLIDLFGRDHLYLELQDDYTPDSLRVSQGLVALARRLDVGIAATNNVHYAESGGYAAHDLLRCISAGVALDTPHRSRPLNRERRLKSASEMEQVFWWCPEALKTTEEIAARCGSAFPTEDITPRFEGDAPAALRELSYQGARERYGSVTSKVRDRLEHELSVITTLGFADYVLLCRDIVGWARWEQNIRVTGRGSAADSCVAYCLRLTDVDVIERGLPFARFLMPGKTPDIDCDFPSDRRDEVFRHVQARYGAENVAMVCTFFTYHARSAVRDVGKALALPPDLLEFFSERLYHSLGADHIEEAFDKFHELKGHEHMIERCKRLFDLCAKIAGFPRHIGTHSSGLLISRTPLTCLAPLVPSAKGVLPIFTLDKDDAEEAGGIKFDVLALRILSSVADAEADIQRKEPDFQYDEIPLDDAPTYGMLKQGKGIGVFQFESAAQLALSVELLPEAFEDLVAAVSLIRPSNSSNSNRTSKRGMNTVRQYLDARSGYEPISYLHPCLKPILERTYGCILFQEQVDLVVAAMTGWDHPKAERFRKDLAKHTVKGTLADAGEIFIKAAVNHFPHFSKTRANDLWSNIAGWGGYGFTEGHAASFSITGYKTAYLSIHHVGEFYAGLLNHQPMGFYPPNTLVAEARRRGVTIYPVDINYSDDKSYSDSEGRMRLGMRLVSKLGEADRASILTVRDTHGPFQSFLDFCIRVVVKRDRLENLILAGVFDGLHPHRRGLLLRLDETLTLAAAYRADRNTKGQKSLAFGSWQDVPTPCADDLKDFSPWDRLMWSYRITGVCADAHPLQFFRSKLKERGIITVLEALKQLAGSVVTIAGLNIRPHRPPTRSGRKVLFSTIEDETGFLQIVVLDDALERCTATFLLAPAVEVEGRLEAHGKGSVTLRVENARPLRVAQ